MHYRDMDLLNETQLDVLKQEREALALATHAREAFERHELLVLQMLESHIAAAKHAATQEEVAKAAASSSRIFSRRLRNLTRGGR